MRPERRRRGDLVTAAALAVALAIAGSVLWATGEVAGTSADAATAPAVAPPAADGVPAAFVEVWRAPSAATPVPVVSGPAVTTADGSTVTGRDAVTGAEVWSYSRDVPLCTAAAGFPAADDGVGRVLALYAGMSGWCSELTALRPDTGLRRAAANPDIRPGARLLAAGTSVVGTGPDYLEALRSDLVKTLEYGLVSAPAQPDRQPRPGCAHGSTALVAGRIGVLERCPGEATDRLTVLAPDGSEGADQPQEEFSVALPGRGAVLLALSAERAAVALPGPPRLLVLDRTGAALDTVALDLPDADLAADPPGGAAVVRSGAERVYWWTGSRTIALDGTTLTPVWTVPGTLGTALRYGGSVLVPVPAGLAELDATTGAVLRTLPVERADPAAPVQLESAGEVLLEQRGAELVALRPG